MYFSVLLSVYYKERPVFLQECLDSILLQTLPPSEIVIVKDGPLTKALDRVIDEYKLKNSILRVVSLPVNQGLGKALNAGLPYCTYDVVARMDTDDIAKPDRFEKQMAYFECYPDVDVIGAWIDEFEGDPSHIVSVRKVPEKTKDIYDFAKWRNPVNHPVVAFRKKAVLEAGGYLHFPLFEDYYLWVRLLTKGVKFYNIQESLLYFRLSSGLFKRRGGWKYAIREFDFQNSIRKIGFISTSEFMANVWIRLVTRLLPNAFRKRVYEKFLR